MHYLVDAYNLFFRIQKKINPIAKKREQFIHQISTLLADLGGRITLVFDAGLTHSHEYPSLTNRGKIEILFTPKGLTADEYIIELVDRSKTPSRIMVVTSDRELSRKVNEHCGQTITVESFLKKLDKAPSKEEKKRAFDTPWEKERLQSLFEQRLRESPDDET